MNNMKIFVIGATGMAGSAIVTEALKRGHEVIANGRTASKLATLKEANAGVETLAKDAFELTPADFNDVDVVVDAFSTMPNTAYLQTDLAAQLVKMFRETTTPRLAFILGAGSLQHGDHLVLDEILADPETMPWRETAIQQKHELTFLKTVSNVNWFGISPAMLFHEGPASENILTGTNELLVNTADNSETTSGTMAVAMLNELENPVVKYARITVANG